MSADGIRWMDGWATDATYSEDDGGWYITVIGLNGVDVHTTDLCPTKQAAINAAAQYTETHDAPNYRAHARGE